MLMGLTVKINFDTSDCLEYTNFMGYMISLILKLP